MPEMTVSRLTVDLLSDRAVVALFKPAGEQVPGTKGYSEISINVPVATPGDENEGKLKQIAIEAARKALREALEALDRHQI